MKWYAVKEEFLNYIRKHESRIPKTDYGPDKFKPFFGALFEVGNLVYLTQVSHPRKRHYKLPANLDFIKLYNDKKLIAVVNLNYMFPVPKDQLIDVKYKNIQDFRTFNDEQERGKYISLMKKEMKQLKSIGINEKAERIYNLKYDYPENVISQRCIDFKDLEIKCKEYKEIN